MTKIAVRPTIGTVAKNLPSQKAPEPMPKETLRVATYNIRKAKGTDRERDPERILAVIADLRADVVMLQEADMRLPPRPPALPVARIREITGLVPVDPGGDGPSMGAHGNALLVAPAWQVEAVKAHDLPGLEPRGMLTARLRGPGERVLRIAGVHLGLLRASRRGQLMAIRTVMTGDMPTVIAGDFNERSETGGLEELGDRFRPLAPRDSFHARWPRWPLDRIVVSRHFTTPAPEVVLDERTRLASDHLPLVATLEWD